MASCRNDVNVTMVDATRQAPWLIIKALQNCVLIPEHKKRDQQPQCPQKVEILSPSRVWIFVP